MKKLTPLFILSFLLVFTLSCKTSTTKDTDAKTDEHSHEDGDHMHADENKSHASWSYQGESGPEHWTQISDEYSTCSGMMQSPINITESVTDEKLEGINVTYFETSECTFINNGHTVQVNFPGDLNMLTVDGTGYYLKQFHFHCPSEHTIEANHTPSEVHLVHISGAGEIAVIGVLVEKGEPNEFLSKILDALPNVADNENKIESGLNPFDLLPAEQSYYTYSGSLTTPPCTEGVNWIVMDKKVSASEEQIEMIKNAMPLNNNRPVQEINDRVVKFKP